MILKIKRGAEVTIDLDPLPCGCKDVNIVRVEIRKYRYNLTVFCKEHNNDWSTSERTGYWW